MTTFETFKGLIFPRLTSVMIHCHYCVGPTRSSEQQPILYFLLIEIHIKQYQIKLNRQVQVHNISEENKQINAELLSINATG